MNAAGAALSLVSVGWGTFVGVVWLGAADGVADAVRWEFRDLAANSLWVTAGVGSGPALDASHAAAARALPHVARASARLAPWGTPAVAAGERVERLGVVGVDPDYAALERIELVRGRFVDPIDQRDRARVAVVGAPAAELLFADADPVGRWLAVESDAYRVVGVFDDAGGGGSKARQVLIPLATAHASVSGSDRIDGLLIELDTADPGAAAQAEDALRRRMPDGVTVKNNVTRMVKFERLFALLDAFGGVVGLGTASAGLVGVSNLLLASVAERRAEIGLRKALGATPARIVAAVVGEAVALTGCSGVGGVVCGAAVLAAVRAVVPPNELLRDPSFHPVAAVAAVAALLGCGVVAAVLPAWRAAALSPAEALR